MTPNNLFSGASAEHPELYITSSSSPGERRAKMRFPLDLPVRYRTVGGGRPRSGEGRVLNVSSCGILILRRHQLSVGVHVELRVEWPLLLDGRIGLQLVARGKVVRCGKAHFAVEFQKHQFRTASVKSRPDASPLAITPSQPIKKPREPDP